MIEFLLGRQENYIQIWNLIYLYDILASISKSDLKKNVISGAHSKQKNFICESQQISIQTAD